MRLLHSYITGRWRPLDGLVPLKVGRFATVTLLLVFSFMVLLLLVVMAGPVEYFGIGPLADLSGFLALALIAATGVLMVFKKRLTAWMGSPERLWRLHIVVAGVAGVFLALHVILLLAFPISLPVFLGYIGTGAALFVWITGSIFFQGARNSMFYHGVFSTGAIFLIVVHTFGAGRNIPQVLSGVSLAVIAIVFLVGVGSKLAVSWNAPGAEGA